MQAPPDRQTCGSETTETEVVVIGSGVGGLSCGALLAKYGVKVVVLESHDIPGGAAHSWVQKGYHFESGPSLYSDMASRGDPVARCQQTVRCCRKHAVNATARHVISQTRTPACRPEHFAFAESAGRAANPLAQVLQAIDEPLELIEYNTWNILVPEGEYLTEVKFEQLCMFGTELATLHVAGVSHSHKAILRCAAGRQRPVL